MDKFKIAFEQTLGHEGGYSNDTDDRGGETFKGIARRHWPKWEGWQIVDAVKDEYPPSLWNTKLTKNEQLTDLVERFYRSIFWDRLMCNNFDQEIASELFDTGVNQGQFAAATYLQFSLNKLNRNQKDYPDLIVDGKLGSNTISAYEAYMLTQRFSSRNEAKLIKWLLKWMNYFQLRKYATITDNSPSQEKFIPGWTERV